MWRSLAKASRNLKEDKNMVNNNGDPAEEPTEGRDLDKNDPASNQGSDEEVSLKGGGDGKAKDLGGKSVGDYVKTDKSKRTYE
jgi:hypothetical protein